MTPSAGASYALHRTLREVRAPVDAHLDEGALVDQEVDPLARGELAARVLLFDLLGAASELRLIAPLVEIADERLHPGFLAGIRLGGCLGRIGRRARSCFSVASLIFPSIRFALFEERRDALDRVLGRELDRELRAQVVERLDQRHVELAPHRVLAELHHQRRLRRELLRPLGDRGVELLAGHDLVDDPGLARLFGGQPIAQQEHLRRLLARDVPVDQRHDHEREEPDVDLGRAEPGGVLGDDEVASEGDAERAGEDVAGRGDDRRLAQLAELDEDLREEPGGEVLVGGRRIRREAAEVAARREDLLVGGGEHHDASVVVFLDRAKRVQELRQQLIGERVPGLRIVEGDGRDAVCDLELDLLVSSHE